MPSTLVKDLLYRVSVQLHDVSPQFVRWTERELVSWLNDGQRAIAKYLPYSCVRVDSIKLRPGTKQSIESIASGDIVPGDGSSATQVFGIMIQAITRNMGSNGTTPGRVIRLIDRETLDASYPGWHLAANAGAPTQYCFDPRTPKIAYVSPPVPSTGTYWAEFNYLADPPPITGSGFGFDGSSAVKVSIDDRYVDDLVNYILARAYMKDAEYAEDVSLSGIHTNLFVQSLNAQVAGLTGVNPNLQTLPFNPAIPGAAK